MPTFPYIYKNHGPILSRDVRNAEGICLFFRENISEKAKKQLEEAYPKIFPEGIVNWDTDYSFNWGCPFDASTAWNNTFKAKVARTYGNKKATAARQKHVDDYRAELEGFIEYAARNYPLLYAQGSVCADLQEKDPWNIWSQKQYLETCGPLIAETFYKCSHFDDKEKLEKEIKNLQWHLFLAKKDFFTDRSFTKDIEKNPQKYVEIFRKIIEKSKKIWGTKDTVYLCLIAILASRCEGVMPHEDVYEKALEGIRAQGYLNAKGEYTFDPYKGPQPTSLFQNDWFFVDSLERTGKKLKRTEEKEFKSVIGLYKKLQREGMAEFKQDYEA